MGNAPLPVGVATVTAPSTIQAPTVVPVGAGVSVLIDWQTPAASAIINGLSLAVDPAAANMASTTSSPPSSMALADVLTGWIANAPLVA